VVEEILGRGATETPPEPTPDRDEDTGEAEE
jgi:hypothetical protein